MRLTRVVILGIALVAGILAAVLALNLSSRRTPPPAPVAVAKVDKTQVLVAAKDIETGTRIAANSIKWVDWPRTGVSPSFIERAKLPDGIDKVAGAFARTTFYAGEPIVEPKLVRSNQGFMSAILPQGKRAIAMRIAVDTSAGGFILPNDKVDIVTSRQSSSAASGPGGILTETILRNIRVLAINQAIGTKNGERVVIGQTATLELTPQQVEIVAGAQMANDRVILALRSIADSGVGAELAEVGSIRPVAARKARVITVVRNGVLREIGGIR